MLTVLVLPFALVGIILCLVGAYRLVKRGSGDKSGWWLIGIGIVLNLWWILLLGMAFYKFTFLKENT